MKHYSFLLLFVAISLSSCSLLQYNYVQVFEAQSSTVKNQDDTMVYEDDNCAIRYALWAEGGDASFAIYNKTDEMLTIDPGKSFFIRNGIAQDYYTNQPVIAIPPHTSRIMKAPLLKEDLLLDCDLDRYPEETASISYNEENSPLCFTNYITYSIGKSTTQKVIENKFYISKITNYAEPYAYSYVERPKRPCQNLTDDDSKTYDDSYPTKVYDLVYKFNLSNRFYLKYHKWSNRKLYKYNGKRYFYNETFKGYTTINSNEDSDYKRRLLHPFAQP